MVQRKREEIGRTPFTARLQNASVKHQAELQDLFERTYGTPRTELSKGDLEMVLYPSLPRTCATRLLQPSISPRNVQA